VVVVPERHSEASLRAVQRMARHIAGVSLSPDRIDIGSRLSNGGMLAPRRRRLSSLVLERAGNDFTVKVTLELAGDLLRGEAHSPCARRLEYQAVARATLSALAGLLDSDPEIESVDLVQVGEVRIARVLLYHEGGYLVGSVVVRLDDHDAVARATLNALNRSVGGDETRLGRTL
jgi:hypothetical protein